MATARRRRGWSQRELGRKVGLTQARQSQIEAGKAGGMPTELWFALADALGVPFRFALGRDPLQELEDSGHLELQEFMLKLGRLTGRRGTFELQARAFPGLSVDVGLRDDVRRLVLLQECWNTFGNLGAGVRNTRRKVVELEDLAVAVGGEQGPYKVAACWVVRDVPRNRAIVARYPEIFRSTVGASSEWVAALTCAGVNPPATLGFVWCDPRAKRLTPLRL